MGKVGYSQSSPFYLALIYMDTCNNQIIIDKLKGLGIHVTKTRITVLRMLIEKKTALSVFDINRSSRGSLDRVSVYRTFQDFLQRGIVTKVPTYNGEVKYLLHLKDRNSSVDINQPAAYLCCTDCGAVVEVNEIKIPELEIPVNFIIQRSQLLFEGICKNCLPSVSPQS